MELVCLYRSFLFRVWISTTIHVSVVSPSDLSRMYGTVKWSKEASLVQWRWKGRSINSSRIRWRLRSALSPFGKSLIPLWSIRIISRPRTAYSRSCLRNRKERYVLLFSIEAFSTNDETQFWNLKTSVFVRDSLNKNAQIFNYSFSCITAFTKSFACVCISNSKAKISSILNVRHFGGKRPFQDTKRSKIAPRSA